MNKFDYRKYHEKHLEVLNERLRQAEKVDDNLRKRRMAHEKAISLVLKSHEAYAKKEIERRGKRTMRININISDDLHNDLKVRMAIKKRTMKDFIIEAIEDKLNEDKKEVSTIQRLEEFVKRQKDNL